MLLWRHKHFKPLNQDYSSLSTSHYGWLLKPTQAHTHTNFNTCILIMGWFPWRLNLDSQGLQRDPHLENKLNHLENQTHALNLYLIVKGLLFGELKHCPQFLRGFMLLCCSAVSRARLFEYTSVSTNCITPVWMPFPVDTRLRELSRVSEPTLWPCPVQSSTAQSNRSLPCLLILPEAINHTAVQTCTATHLTQEHSNTYTHT